MTDDTPDPAESPPADWPPPRTTTSDQWIVEGSWPTFSVTPLVACANHEELWRKIAAGSPNYYTLTGPCVNAVATDPITPAEAAEELDDAESEELAAHEAAEAKAGKEPGANRTWAELDLCVEQEFRRDLNAVESVSQIFMAHAKRNITDGEEAGMEWKLAGLDTMPEKLKREFVGYLTAVAVAGRRAAERIGGDA